MPVNFNGSDYTQDFNTLASSGTGNVWANDSTIAGWSLFRQPAPGTPITTYNADTGTSNSGSFNSYGAVNSTERALGGAASGGVYFGSPVSGAVAGWIAFAATNTSGSTINTLNVGFSGEQWRNGGNIAAQPMNLEYGIGSTFGSVSNWIAPGGNFNWVSPIATATAVALGGNAVANGVDNLGGALNSLNWANNDTLWFRWAETNDSANDHGLAIDDFSISTTVNPSTPGVTINQSGGSTSVTEGGATDTYSIVLNTVPTADVNIALNPGTQVTTSLANLTFTPVNWNIAQTVTVTAVDDTVVESNHTGAIAHTLTSTDAGYSSVTVGNVNVNITDNDVVSAAIRIRDIQGAKHISPLNGQSVTAVPGIVTAVGANGFYLQDPTPDSDDRTSEAIFVFTSSAPTVTVGTSVTVSGTVAEFRPGSNAGNLTITQISSPTITTVSTGNPLPAAIVLGNGGRTIPTTVIDNDTTGNIETGTTTFDPAQDGIDFYESLEGMRVQVNNPVSTSPTANFSANEEIWVLADNGVNATSRTSRGGSLITETDFNPERIQIDDLISSLTLPVVNVGAQLSTVTGVVGYDFNNYEVLVSTAPTVVTASPLQKEITSLIATANQLTVATFNVENLDANDLPAKFSGIASAIVTNLKSPDILNLEEIQDNNGATNDSITAANVTFETLISAIAAAGGPTYQYRQINPVDDTNGGEPGGNIRVGFLFNPSRVSFVDNPGGTATFTTAVTDTNSDGIPELSDNPGLIDPTNSAFNASRKPLVGEFIFNGQTVYVIGNHFNSKGGDQALFGPVQPPVQSSQVQRNQQATIVKNFVQSILTINPNANVIVAGDINDFEFSSPVTILESGGLNTLVEALPANERYTYNFQGNAQSLDHLLVSNNLSSKLDGVDVVHINSEFKDQVSDHDPVLARFNLPVPKTRNDFNGDRKSDILWRNDFGSVALWQMDGATVTSPNLTSVPDLDPSWKAAGTGDFNGDGKSDILWRNTDGSIAIWAMNGATVRSSTRTSTPTLDNSWTTAGTGDYNGDGKSDILWRNTNGAVAIWTMDGAIVTLSNLTTTTSSVDNSWKVAGNSDFNGDGKADILWRNDDGSVALWQMNGSGITAATAVATVATDWKIAGTGDFNNDSKADILWRNDDGRVALWQMNGAEITSSLTSTPSRDRSQTIAGIDDYNGDGKSDILWRKDTGALEVWQMNGSTVLSSTLTSVTVDSSSWKIAAPII